MTSTKKAVNEIIKDLNRIPSGLNTNNKSKNSTDSVEKIKKAIEDEIMMKLKQGAII